MQTITANLLINVSTIGDAYKNGTGSQNSPTLLTNTESTKFYEPMGLITADTGDVVEITCKDNTGAVSITAITLTYESGDDILDSVTESGSLFTIDADKAGTEEFYAVFSFTTPDGNYYCKIDPALKVSQGGGG